MRAIKVYCPPGVEPPLYAFIDALDGKLKATKTIGKSTGKGNRGAASGSTTGGPRIGGGPSGAHNAAGHTASYQAYQATQQQNTSQGADGQGFVSQRESVQSGGAQTATQEHFSNSSMQNTSSIRQTAFRGAEARKSSVPSGMRRAPAYVTSVDRVSPSSAQTPAAGYDTSGTPIPCRQRL